MGVDSIDDIPSIERRRQQKKKERLEAQHRMMWLATLRQRQAQKIPVVAQHLLAALAPGKSARTGMPGALPSSGHQTQAEAGVLDQACEREQEHIARGHSESQIRAGERHKEQLAAIKVGIKMPDASERKGVDAAHQRARQMLNAVLPQSRLQRGETAAAESARSAEEAHQHEADAQTAALRTAEQSHVALEHSSAQRSAVEVRQRSHEHKQQDGRNLQSRQDAQTRALNRSRQNDRRDKEARAESELGHDRQQAAAVRAESAARSRARDAAKHAAGSGDADQPGPGRPSEHWRTSTPQWLSRLQKLAADTARKEDIAHLQADIEVALRQARSARSREQGQERTGHAPNIDREVAPLALRELQGALAHLRVQAERNPALAPLADGLHDLLTMTRRAEQASRKRDEKLAQENGGKPGDDDTTWMRRIDQMAQALSGVLGPDVQAKALQTLLGPDVARLDRLMTQGAVPSLLEAQQLRLERRALKLERWALKEHGTKLAEELRDWLNRERRRVEQAENPSAVAAAGAGPAQHGAEDNVFLKQAQSL